MIASQVDDAVQVAGDRGKTRLGKGVVSDGEGWHWISRRTRSTGQKHPRRLNVKVTFCRSEKYAQTTNNW